MFWTGWWPSLLLQLRSLEKTFLEIKWRMMSTVQFSSNVLKESFENPIPKFLDSFRVAWIMVINISYGLVPNSRCFLVRRRWSICSQLLSCWTFPHIPFTMLSWTPPLPLAQLRPSLNPQPNPNLMLGNDRNWRKNQIEQGRGPRGDDFRVRGFFPLEICYFYFHYYVVFLLVVVVHFVASRNA